MRVFDKFEEENREEVGEEGESKKGRRKRDNGSGVERSVAEDLFGVLSNNECGQ